MAISMKTTKDFGFDLLEKFGVDSALISLGKKFGVVIDSSLNGNYQVKFAGTVYGTVLIKPNVLSLLKTNQLGPTSKQALANQFESALKKAVDVAKDSGVKVSVHSVTMDVHGNIVEETQPIFNPKPVAKKAVAPKATAGDLFSASSIMQAVKGTSSTSIYVVFARFKGLNLALRREGQSFSIRAAGPMLSNYMASLTEFGISQNAGYASGHFNAEEDDLVVKSLGAICAAVGFQELIEIGDMSKVVEEATA